MSTIGKLVDQEIDNTVNGRDATIDYDYSLNALMGHSQSEPDSSSLHQDLSVTQVDLVFADE
jgi:hypothetical protein